MKPFMRTAVCVALFAAGISLAAPAKKDKVEDLGPIREEQLSESVNNLKQIGIAFHNFNDVNGTLPTNQLSNDKKPLLSWRVQILPYIDEDKLFREFKLDEPWDSAHNKKLIDRIPKLYAPVRGKWDAGLTFYQTFGGKNGWCKPGAAIPNAFPDGTSNTFMVAEAGKPIIWTKPSDMEFDGKTLPALGGLFDGKFHATMGDGSASLFKKGLEDETLRRLIDPADGNVVDVNAARDEGK